jgi:hypothetical protein
MWMSHNFRNNSELEQATRPNPLEKKIAITINYSRLQRSKTLEGQDNTSSNRFVLIIISVFSVVFVLNSLWFS